MAASAPASAPLNFLAPDKFAHLRVPPTPRSASAVRRDLREQRLPVARVVQRILFSSTADRDFLAAGGTAIA